MDGFDHLVPGRHVLLLRQQRKNQVGRAARKKIDRGRRDDQADAASGPRGQKGHELFGGIAVLGVVGGRGGHGQSVPQLDLADGDRLEHCGEHGLFPFFGFINHMGASRTDGDASGYADVASISPAWQVRTGCIPLNRGGAGAPGGVNPRSAAWPNVRSER